MAATTFSTISTDAPNVYVAREMYKIAERKLVLGRYASRYVLPQRFSKTIRIDRFARMALPTTPLTEGVPPDTVALSVQNVDVTLEQWGIVTFITDVGLITTVHPALQLAIDRTALAIVETLEREIAKALLAGTSVIYGGAVSARGSLAATDVMTSTVVLKATTQLRALGAPEYDGGLYAGVIAPQQEGDLLRADTVFQSAHNYVNVKALEYGEIGIWMGVRWARGNFMPVFVGVAEPSESANSATVSLVAGAAGGAYNDNATLSGGIIVVARDVNSDYERKISVSHTTLALGAGNTALVVTTPTSTNYLYDIYAPPAAAGTGTPVLAASRQAANTAVTISSLPTSSTTAPVNPASGVSVFVAWVFGKDAYGRVELNGMSMQSYVTPAGASFSNPLAQGRKIGSKIMWKPFILDDNFFVRVETGSSFSAQLPS